MKIHIYRTLHQFLEEPIKIGTCEDFSVQQTVAYSACPDSKDLQVKQSKLIATIPFGRYVFDAVKCPPCGAVLVPIKR